MGSGVLEEKLVKVGFKKARFDDLEGIDTASFLLIVKLDLVEGISMQGNMFKVRFDFGGIIDMLG